MSLDLSTIKALILDMDGVIWRGDHPIGDLPGIFAAIRSSHLQVMLATNNATSSPQTFVKKLASFGVQLDPGQIINSGEVTLNYLTTRFPTGGPIHILGEPGLVEILAQGNFFHQPANRAVLAVVAGLDRELTYSKLFNASLLIRSGVPFIATNTDPTLPIPGGIQAPGAGTVIAALRTASDIAPIVMGKPSPEIINACLSRMQVRPEETLVVGDRLETDIAGGQAAGCKTALVLSGVTTLAQAESWRPSIDLITRDLSSLVGIE